MEGIKNLEFSDINPYALEIYHQFLALSTPFSLGRQALATRENLKMSQDKIKKFNTPLGN